MFTLEPRCHRCAPTVTLRCANCKPALFVLLKKLLGRCRSGRRCWRRLSQLGGCRRSTCRLVAAPSPTRYVPVPLMLALVHALQWNLRLPRLDVVSAGCADLAGSVGGRRKPRPAGGGGGRGGAEGAVGRPRGGGPNTHRALCFHRAHSVPCGLPRRPCFQEMLIGPGCSSCLTGPVSADSSGIAGLLGGRIAGRGRGCGQG